MLFGGVRDQHKLTLFFHQGGFGDTSYGKLVNRYHRKPLIP